MTAVERSEVEAPALATPRFALDLLEAAPDAILVVRPDGHIGLANRMAEQLFGHPRTSLVGMSVESLIPGDRRARHEQQRLRFTRAPRARAMGELERLEALTASGETLPVEISLSPVDTVQGRMTIAIVRDVRARRALEHELRRASTHDALTGCFNRAHLDSIRQGLDSGASPVGLVMVDVDGLKAINDRMGHEVGDQILRRCALVLRTSFGPSAIVVRLGGDEFLVVLPQADPSGLEDAVRRLQADIDHHDTITRGPTLAVSIGSALVSSAGGLAAGMRAADRRMYDEKRSHRPAPPR